MASNYTAVKCVAKCGKYVENRKMSQTKMMVRAIEEYRTIPSFSIL
jgi:hypothetical protein